MKLSVVIPIYSNEEYIRPALDSLVTQTICHSEGDGDSPSNASLKHSLEIIIINDAGTDEADRIASQFISDNADLDIKYLRLQENLGPSKAREWGVKMAEGEFIGFLDGDDWIDADYYETLLAIAEVNAGGEEEREEEKEKERIDIVCSAVVREKEKAKPALRPGASEVTGADSRVRVLNRKEALMEVFNRTSVYQYAVNKIYRRDLLLKIIDAGGFARSKFIGEDFDLVCRAIDLAERIAVTDRATYHYRIHPAGETSRGFTEERRLAYEKYGEYLNSFGGGEEQKAALKRYLMLEYMSFLTAMYRSKKRDPVIEAGIIDFVRENRGDYIRNASDGVKAKVFAAIINRTLSNLFYHIWPKNRE